MRAAKAQTSLPIRASALTVHIHIEGCEFENGKAGHLGIRYIYHTSVDVCTQTVLHAKISLAPHSLISTFVFRKH